MTVWSSEQLRAQSFKNLFSFILSASWIYLECLPSWEMGNKNQVIGESSSPGVAGLGHSMPVSPLANYMIILWAAIPFLPILKSPSPGNLQFFSVWYGTCTCLSCWHSCLVPILEWMVLSYTTKKLLCLMGGCCPDPKTTLPDTCGPRV